MMMHKTIGIVIAGILIFLTGCKTKTPSPTSIPIPSPAKLNITFTQLVNTPVPVLIPTLTQVFTPRVIPSPIPVAQLPLEEAKERFDMLAGSPGCQVPCFNGLTPGMSDDWQVQDFLAGLGLDDSSIQRDSQGRWLMPLDQSGYWLFGRKAFQVPYLLSSNRFGSPKLYVGWGNGKVTDISLGPLPYREWISIPRWLSMIDEKPTILFYEGNGGEGIDRLHFGIAIGFSEHQTTVMFIGKEQGSYDKPIACISPTEVVDVVIILGSSDVGPNIGLVNWITGYELFLNQLAWDWATELNISEDALLTQVSNGDFCLPAK